MAESDFSLSRFDAHCLEVERMGNISLSHMSVQELNRFWKGWELLKETTVLFVNETSIGLLDEQRLCKLAYLLCQIGYEDTSKYVTLLAQKHTNSLIDGGEHLNTQ